MHLTDEELAVLAQRGDHAAFASILERYEEKIKRYAKKFLALKEDISDITQEIFLKAYQNIKSFDTARRFSPWLYRIAHNELVNVLKKKKREPLLFFDFDSFFPHPFSREEADGLAKRNEIKKMIELCLEKLESKYREPLVLYYFEDLNYGEIADVMAMPISTVGVRIKRGREQMRNLCEKYDKR